MKRLSACLIVSFMLCCFLTSCEMHTEGNRESTEASVFQEPVSDQTTQTQEEMRAVWITYYEISMKAQKGGDQGSFSKKVDEMFSRVQKAGFNTVIVQVRPYSDAFYPSKIFPWSTYLTGTQGQDPGYDPLAILVERAHAHQLSIHAWFNPYRVAYNTDFSLLSKNNPARKWKEDADKSNDQWIFVLDNGIYYNPAAPEVQRMIIDGVREIVENYEVDGVHMDDYFYPSTDETIDQAQYDAYVKSGGQYSRAA
uniref:glycoside hydrolase family 10 protein n=1 Tax=Candidatus Fimivicinus sp. TaxID=3056640 RepID=UPI003FEEA603